MSKRREESLLGRAFGYHREILNISKLLFSGWPEAFETGFLEAKLWKGMLLALMSGYSAEELHLRT